MNLVSGILGVVVLFALQVSSEAWLTDALAYKLINEDRLIVQEGFRDAKWISEEMLWFEVDECVVDGLDTIGARGNCQVCSIDKVGKQVYDKKYTRYAGDISPSYAVTITTSVAQFRKGLNGWQFSSFEPLGTNYLSSTGHPYHRADLKNLKLQAPYECADMRSIQEFVIRG